MEHSDLVNAVTVCPLCSKQDPRQLPKESGTIHKSLQPAKDWQIDYIGPVSLSEGSKYALVCVDTTSGLTQGFP